MKYEYVRFNDDELIGYIGACSYCGREISECCKYENILRGITCAKCFVWYCYDMGIKCKETQNVIEI